MNFKIKNAMIFVMYWEHFYLIVPMNAGTSLEFLRNAGYWYGIWSSSLTVEECIHTISKPREFI